MIFKKYLVIFLKNVVYCFNLFVNDGVNMIKLFYLEKTNEIYTSRYTTVY